jgi:hypothetical protein
VAWAWSEGEGIARRVAKGDASVTRSDQCADRLMELVGQMPPEEQQALLRRVMRAMVAEIFEADPDLADVGREVVH